MFEILDIRAVETPFDMLPDTRGQQIGKSSSYIHRSAHHQFGNGIGTKTFLGAFRTGKIYRSLKYVVCLAGKYQGQHHDHACDNEDKQRRLHIRIEHIHVHVDIPCLAVCLIRSKRSQRNTNKIDQVIARKGHRQGEGSGKHDHLQDIDLEHRHQQLRNEGEKNKAYQHQQHRMRSDPCLGRRRNDGRAFCPLEQQIKHDRRQSHSTDQTSPILQPLTVIERQHKTNQPLYHHSCDKGDNHHSKYSRNHRDSFLIVDIITQSGQISHKGKERGDIFRPDHLEYRHGYRSSQQFEYHRHGCGGRQSQGIEYIQQDNVGNHHRQINHDHLLEHEHFGMKNASARYFHHTVGKYRAKNNAYGGHYDDKLERSGSGSDRRPDKIDRVVAYSHDEVQHGQCPHQHHQKEKDIVHYASV